mmetsp:Transcript_12579/g.36460  ORF Transcript_12579/g.36460 Transcript_12579/m.36460 type:complete len:218 (-) Transcript_12579:387-1040(-)
MGLLETIVASCCAEVVQKLTLFPLDTVKTRLQCSRREGPSARPSSPLQEMAQVLAALVREPGWVASLYRGVVPAVLGCIPTALVQSSGPLSRLPSFDSFQQRPCAAAGVHAHLRALSTPLPTPWHSVGCGGGHWSCQRQREGAYPGYQSQTTAPALPRLSDGVSGTTGRGRFGVPFHRPSGHYAPRSAVRSDPVCSAGKCEDFGWHLAYQFMARPLD